MSLERALAPFQALLDAPRPGGDGAVGWIGLDVPLELIDAAGRSPVRVTADPAAPAEAAAPYGEGGGHPQLRALVSRLAGVDHFERLVIGSRPVTGVWLYNLLLSLEDDRPGFGHWSAQLFDLARNGRPSARRLDLESIQAFAAVFPPRDGAVALARAIIARNDLRRLMREVDALRAGARPRLSGVAARTILDGVELAPVDTGRRLLRTLLGDAERLPVVGGLPVVYSGTGGSSLALYRALEAHGLRIVGDDQDFGTRAIGPDVRGDGDPFEALAERYRDRDPAPAGWSSAERAAWLTDLTVARGAAAVIFEIAPFDHPSGWDLPLESSRLKAAGVASIVLPADAWRAPEAAARIAAEALFSPTQLGAARV